MREIGIRLCYIKNYTKTTIQPDFRWKLRNILKEQFDPVEPNAVWCLDITYIGIYTGFVYLTSIMDLYFRKIIPWVLSDTLEAKWVTDAIGRRRKHGAWISQSSCTATVEYGIPMKHIWGDRRLGKELF